MEAENEPKVSVHMFVSPTYQTCFKFDFCLSDCSRVWPSGLVCFLGSLQRPHHPLAQTGQRRAVDLLSAAEKFKG